MSIKSIILSSAIGARIRDLRKKRNLTQKHVADALGLTAVQIHKYEKGITRISRDKLEKIANYLNIPVEHLSSFTIENKPFQSEIYFKSQEIDRLINAYKSLPSYEIRKNILQLIESLNNKKKTND